jgi:hypothetical protein
MEEKYFVISNSDGDTYVEALTKSQLLTKLKEEYEDEDEKVEYMSLNGVMKESDTNYWGEKLLIIKGSVVKPFDKEVIVKKEVDIE